MSDSNQRAERNKLIIRSFTDSDRKSLQHVYLKTRKLHFTWLDVSSLKLSDFERDTEGECIWVCEKNGAAVGFIAAQVPNNFIHHLFVLPQFAGIGVGSALLQSCLNEIGLPAQLKCVTENTQALNFYVSKGWKSLSQAIGSDGEYHLMEITNS